MRNKQAETVPAPGGAGHEKLRRVIGWVAVGITVAFVGVWTYWGIVENFHEGWYAESVWENLGMLFIQYLLITVVFCALAAVSLRWRRIGLALHVVAAQRAGTDPSGADPGIAFPGVRRPAVGSATAPSASGGRQITACRRASVLLICSYGGSDHP